MSARAVVIAASVLLLATPLARAEDTRRRGPDPRGERDEAFRIVDAYVVANLKESLGLGDATYVKAIPLVKELQEARRGYFVDRGRALRGLRSLLRSGTATKEDVLGALEAVKQIDASGPDRIRAASAALDAILSPMEQAKYRVFELDVEYRMRDMMGHARRDRPRPREERR